MSERATSDEQIFLAPKRYKLNFFCKSQQNENLPPQQSVQEIKPGSFLGKTLGDSPGLLVSAVQVRVISWRELQQPRGGKTFFLTFSFLALFLLRYVHVNWWWWCHNSGN
jgi:hypothetical protein